MSEWRRKAIEMFPDLRPELQRKDYTIYMAFFDLFPRLREAQNRGDKEEMQRIGEFAAWCARQKAKDLWNAAGVSFYEHLAFHEETIQLIPELVPPDVFADVRSLLEGQLGAERYAQLVEEYQKRRIGEELQTEELKMAPPNHGYIGFGEEETVLSLACQRAAGTLSIVVIAPCDLLWKGMTYRYAALFPHFGNARGAMMIALDSSGEHDLAEVGTEAGFFCSRVNVSRLTTKTDFVDMLNDLGWFGQDALKPDWYTGETWGEGK